MAREGFVKLFLRNHLPRVVEYPTGEIIDGEDNRSGQIDLVLQSAFHPRLPLFDGLEVALVEGVVGVIEVKSQLTTSDKPEKNTKLTEALGTTAQAKRLKRLHPLRSPISSAWKNGEHPNTPAFVFSFLGPKVETLLTRIEDFGSYKNYSPDEYLPEVIVVLGEDYALIRNDGFLFERKPEAGEYLTIDGPNILFVLFAYINKLIEVWIFNGSTTDFSVYCNDL